MRLFLAIYPPKSYLDHVRDTLRLLDKEKRNIIPTKIENVHFTVRFIGSKVSVSTKQQIAKAFLKFSGNFVKPEFQLEEFRLGFPGQHHPRVMFYDVAANEQIDELVEQSHKLIRQVGAKDTILWKSKDEIDYHLSVGRLKPAAVTNSTIRRVKDLVEAVDIAPPEPFTADEMYLVQSDVTIRGPIYKKLERIRL